MDETMVDQLLKNLFSGFKATITGYADGIRSTVPSLIYADGTGTSQKLSAFMIVAVIAVGIAAATGLVMGTFNWLKNLI